MSHTKSTLTQLFAQDDFTANMEMLANRISDTVLKSIL
jgi:hypothetical protein